MNILVIAAHPDDEVLGCGGTIAKFVSEGNLVHSIIVAEGITSRSKKRDRQKKRRNLTDIKKDALKASKILGIKKTKFLNMPDNRLDSINLIDIVKKIENIINKFKPNAIFTHHAGDLNIDHRIVHQAVMTACRPHSVDFVEKIICFENISSTEWQSISSNTYFKPNYFENIENQLDKKILAMKQYVSEIREWPHPRSIEFINILAKYRGSISGLNLAEAFFIERMINFKK